MKIFGWMQNKLNRNRNTNATAPTYQTNPSSGKEEFKDWPHGLLAIGTFGNTSESVNENHISYPQLAEEDNPSSSEDILEDFTPEEVEKLQSELTKLLSRKPANSSNVEGKVADLPLDEFLNCPSSLGVDRPISNTNAICSEAEDEDEDIERTISVILHRCKGICANSEKKKIRKRSVAFLLKKIFVCANGFGPAPSLRGTLQESRMEKFLRKMLHKKINSPNSSHGASSLPTYMENRQKLNVENEEEKQEKIGDVGHKWVKTDSEYIVLEM
ncbi:protein NEGATIVE GRAVITROPIC RESPONSE OF ROOTS [Malania oleifera]|uniref:protein NEGATIVE GRAVITROPIC RESPONSE OF ROOTS n=1 Tax=Malania oleifera TaxID=397392 RepID=UPI0025AEAB03|nr:protein NEGATIVE GRAVITROPIC RESPONSE OF ROOTS [Malania oleifera]